MITYTLQASDLYLIIDEAIEAGYRYADLRRQNYEDSHEFLEKARSCCLINAQYVLLERGEKTDTGLLEEYLLP